MKLLKYIIPFFIALIITSCSSNTSEDPINEIDGLQKVQEITNDTHIIELYTTSGQLEQGYNEITLRIKDKNSNEYIENAQTTWKPLMHMVSRTHSCPKSEVKKVADTKTIYRGFIIFQMPENDDEGWNLTFNYQINGTDYTAVDDISVPQSSKRRCTVFMGSDGVKYILALVAPTEPKVALNDMTVALYKMENMMSFPVVADDTIKLDPRMPSMGNHSSPNNVDLTYNTDTQMYEGKLALTMTGYWKLNLILLNNNGEILKGEEVNDNNESSSLFLELEF